MVIPQLISLLLPTRGRPALAKDFFQRVADQSTYPEAAEIVLYVDEDDVESHHLDHPDIRIDRIIGPKLTMGATTVDVWSNPMVKSSSW